VVGERWSQIAALLFGDLLGGSSADATGTVTLKLLTSHQHLAPMGHHGGCAMLPYVPCGGRLGGRP
jgi:hypothetical protein